METLGLIVLVLAGGYAIYHYVVKPRLARRKTPKSVGTTSSATTGNSHTTFTGATTSSTTTFKPTTTATTTSTGMATTAEDDTCIERVFVNDQELTLSNSRFSVPAGKSVVVKYHSCPLPDDIREQAEKSIRTDKKASPKAGTAVLDIIIKKDGGLPADVGRYGSEWLTLSMRENDLDPRRMFVREEQNTQHIHYHVLPWEGEEGKLVFIPRAKGTKEHPASISITFVPSLKDVDGERTLYGRIEVEG